MKRETYFTTKTIKSTARSMLEAVTPFRAYHTDIAFRPDHAALFVLDMQEYFLRPSSHAFIPSAPAIIPNLQLLIANFHAANRPIIFTRHVNTDADAGMMSRWWRDLIREESENSAIVPALNTSRGTIIVKPQYDAFHDSQLDEILRGRGVEQVLITGVHTHLCCETTARSAFMHGFEVLFCIDGTATYTDKVHRASLINLAHGFAIPVLCDEIAIK